MNVIITICILMILIVIGLLLIFKYYNKKEYKLEGGAIIYRFGYYFVTVINKIVYQTSLEKLIKVIMNEYGEKLLNLTQNDRNYTLNTRLIHRHWRNYEFVNPRNYIIELCLNDGSNMKTIISHELKSSITRGNEKIDKDYDNELLNYFIPKTLFIPNAKNIIEDFKIRYTLGKLGKIEFLIPRTCLNINDIEGKQLDTDEQNYKVQANDHFILKVNNEQYICGDYKFMYNLFYKLSITEKKCGYFTQANIPFKKDLHRNETVLFFKPCNGNTLSLYYSKKRLTTLTETHHDIKDIKSIPCPMKIGDIDDVKLFYENLQYTNLTTSSDTRSDNHKLTMVIVKDSCITATKNEQSKYKINVKPISEVKSRFDINPELSEITGWTNKLGPMVDMRIHDDIRRFDTCYVNIQFNVYRRNNVLIFTIEDTNETYIQDNNIISGLKNQFITYPYKEDYYPTLSYITNYEPTKLNSKDQEEKEQKREKEHEREKEYEKEIQKEKTEA